jgi:hypothetical protein
MAPNSFSTSKDFNAGTIFIRPGGSGLDLRLFEVLAIGILISIPFNF